MLEHSEYPPVAGYGDTLPWIRRYTPLVDSRYDVGHSAVNTWESFPWWPDHNATAIANPGAETGMAAIKAICNNAGTWIVFPRTHRVPFEGGIGGVCLEVKRQ